MIILDNVKQKIFNMLGQHIPERGGALFGPKKFPVISYFEFDNNAETTSVTYVPSLSLIESVKVIERDTGLEFKGIIHSHPRGIINPSQGDIMAVENLFLNNPHLSLVDLPIVQQCNDINDPQFIHWYHARKIGEISAKRDCFGRKSYYLDGSSVKIYAKDYYTLPLYQDVKKIVSYLTQNGFNFIIPNEPQHLKISNASLFGFVVNSNSNHEFMYFTSIDYPTVPPIILYQQQGETKQLQVDWDSLNNHAINIERVASYLNEELSKGE